MTNKITICRVDVTIIDGKIKQDVCSIGTFDLNETDEIIKAIDEDMDWHINFYKNEKNVLSGGKVLLNTIDKHFLEDALCLGDDEIGYVDFVIEQKLFKDLPSSFITKHIAYCILHIKEGE